MEDNSPRKKKPKKSKPKKSDQKSPSVLRQAKLPAEATKKPNKPKPKSTTVLQQSKRAVAAKKKPDQRKTTSHADAAPESMPVLLPSPVTQVAPPSAVKIEPSESSSPNAIAETKSVPVLLPSPVHQVEESPADKTKGSKSPSKITIDDLRRLVQYWQGNSSQAIAAKQSLSRPGIEKSISKFENSSVFGRLLFKDIDNREFTADADYILPAIKDLVDRYDYLFKFLRSPTGQSRVFRVGTGEFAAHYYLPQTFHALTSNTESLNFRFESRVCRDRERILGTAQGIFDLAIVTYDESEIRRTLKEDRFSDDLLKVTRLGDHPICLLADPKKSKDGQDLQALPEGRAAPLTFLSRRPLIGPDQTSAARRLLEGHFENGELHFVAEGGGWTAAKGMARVGMGVAIVPQTVITDQDKAELVWRRLPEQFKVTDSIIERRERSEDENSFLDKVRQVLIDVAAEVRSGY